MFHFNSNMIHGYGWFLLRNLIIKIYYYQTEHSTGLQTVDYIPCQFVVHNVYYVENVFLFSLRHLS